MASSKALAHFCWSPPWAPEKVAVIGGEHDDGVVGHPRGLERVEDPPDGLIDHLEQVVVETAVGDVGGLLGDHLRPQRLELLLARRAAGERVALRWRLGDVGHRVVGRREPEEQLVETARERDVVRVHERRDREPRPVAGRLGQVAEQVDHLLGEHAVPYRAAVGLRRAVGLSADPAGEPERVEPIGLAVGVDRRGDGSTVVVGGHQALVAPRDRQVGVADVPLAPVVRLVAAGAEPVAEGGDLVGVEPAHARVGVLLGHAVGLRHAVQRRVLPGEQGGPAGHARRRTGVVAVELEAAVAEPITTRHLGAPELRDLGRLVRRRVALLVGHDHQDVG